MTSNYVTMVFRMPDDERQRKQVIDAIGIGKGFHGAECIAMGVGDEMTLNELLVDAALFVDPFLPRDWLTAIRRLQSDRALAERLASNAETKARSLTWDRNASALIDVFSHVSQEEA